jgi:hypothetical protein
MLLPNQLGVKSPGGVEPITHLWQLARTGSLPETTYTNGVSIDCKNAFNTLDRRVIADGIRRHAPDFYRMARRAYNDSSPLYVRGEDGLQILESSQGVRQGDPLGPLLVSLGFRKTVQALVDGLGPSCHVMAYLDDLANLLNGKTMEDAIEIMRQQEGNGVIVNIPKTSSYDLRSGLTEIKMLGSYSGPNPAGFLRSKIDRQQQLIARLERLPAQTSLLLLRRSLQLNLHHLLRTLQLLNGDDGLQQLAILQQWERLDRLARESIVKLRGEVTTVGAWDRTLIHLPVRNGGLGIISHLDTAHALEASIENAKKQLFSFYPTIWKEDDEITSQKFRMIAFYADKTVEFNASLTPAARLQWQDQHAPLAAQWLHAIPTSSFTTLSSREIAVGLHYRTLTIGHNTICRYCMDPNVLGHDELCQQRDKLITKRHEYVKNLLADTLETVKDTTVRVEPRVYGTEGRRGRTDIHITGPASFAQWESHYDVTLVALHAKSCQQAGKVRVQDIVDPLTTVEAINKMLDARAKEKCDKYAPMVRSAFHPIVLSLGGGTLSSSTQQLFNFWRETLGSSKYAYMMRGLGISLLGAKSKFFAL